MLKISPCFLHYVSLQFSCSFGFYVRISSFNFLKLFLFKWDVFRMHIVNFLFTERKKISVECQHKTTRKTFSFFSLLYVQLRCVLFFLNKLSYFLFSWIIFPQSMHLCSFFSALVVFSKIFQCRIKSEKTTIYMQSQSGIKVYACKQSLN